MSVRQRREATAANKRRRQQKEQDGLWAMAQRMTTRMSRWPRWKLTLLAAAMNFLLVVLYTIVTFDGENMKKLKQMK